MRVTDAEAERVRALAGEALARVDEAHAGLRELLEAVGRLRGAVAAAGAGEAPARRPAATLDAARLAAIELAVAGRSRDEVERHLRVVYGGSDTPALLDDVFGAQGERRGASSL